MGLEGGNIVKVAVIDSRSSSRPDIAGWVPLIATTFTEYFDSGTRTVEFRNKKRD